MTSGDKADRAQELAGAAQSARSRTDEVHEQTLRMAEMVAGTEEEVAATLDRLAEDRPHRAERLRALSDAARRHAAQERQWVADQTRSGEDRRGDEQA